MTGYQETLTDPSYAGQIVVMTAPHIGNTGVNDEDPESSRIWVSGYVVRDPSRVVSNYRATRLARRRSSSSRGIVGISGIDTRADHPPPARRGRHARRHLLRSGCRLSRPTSSSSSCGRRPRWSAATCPAEVSTVDGYRSRPRASGSASVAVLDLGVKTSTLRYLAARGFDVNVVPQIDHARGAARERSRMPCSSRTDPATPAHPIVTSSCCRACCARACRSSASASATSCSGARSGSARTSFRSVTVASTSPSRRRHRTHRDHQPQPRLRGGCADRCRSPSRRRASAASRSATSTSTTTSSRDSMRSTSRRSRCSTTPRRPPDRTMPTTCSTGSGTWWSIARPRALLAPTRRTSD